MFVVLFENGGDMKQSTANSLMIALFILTGWREIGFALDDIGNWLSHLTPIGLITLLIVLYYVGKGSKKKRKKKAK